MKTQILGLINATGRNLDSQFNRRVLEAVGQHFTRIALTAGTIRPDKGALATHKRAAKDACVRGVVCESEAHIIIPVFLSFEFSKDRFENSIVFFALCAGWDTGTQGHRFLQGQGTDGLVLGLGLGGVYFPGLYYRFSLFFSD